MILVCRVPAKMNFQRRKDGTHIILTMVPLSIQGASQIDHTYISERNCNFEMFFRPTVASMSVPDDRPIRFTDSPQHYLPSTMSTTSGLGSNYTTNTSSLGQPPTPSPRRKTSASSFSEVPELQYDQNNRQPIYIPGNYVEYRPVEEVANHSGYFGNDGPSPHVISGASLTMSLQSFQARIIFHIDLR